MIRVRRLLDAIVALAGAAAICLACASVFARYAAPSRSVDWSDEVVVMLLIWAMFLSGYGSHPRSSAYRGRSVYSRRQRTAVKTLGADFGRRSGGVYAPVGYSRHDRCSRRHQSWRTNRKHSTTADLHLLRGPAGRNGADCRGCGIATGRASCFATARVRTRGRRRRRSLTEALGLIALLALLLLGVPAFVSIGLVAATLLLVDGLSLGGLAQIILDHLNSSTLTALPFFIIAAAFLQKGGIAAALVEMALAWLGRLNGGLAYVAVAAAAAFSTLSGSSVATAMAVGSTLAPEMERRDYPRGFSLGLIGTTGTLGILLPPSLALIIFGMLTGTSIPKLFLAGIVPGLIQAALLVGFVYITGRRIGLPSEPAVTPAQRVQTTARGLPALLIIATLFVSIYGGLVTPTEAAAVTALLAILASVFVYRGCAYDDVLPTISEGVSNAARIIMIIASALLFSHWIVGAGVADGLLKLLSAVGLSSWQFLLLMNILLLALGIVLEGVSTLLIVTPLAAPLLTPLGIDPLHFAIVIVVNIEIGMLHPPLGMNIFVLASIGKCSTAEVIRGLWPFVG